MATPRGPNLHVAKGALGGPARGWEGEAMEAPAIELRSPRHGYGSYRICGASAARLPRCSPMLMTAWHAKEGQRWTPCVKQTLSPTAKIYNLWTFQSVSILV